MVGTWFGQGEPDNRDSMYLDRFLRQRRVAFPVPRLPATARPMTPAKTAPGRLPAISSPSRSRCIAASPRRAPDVYRLGFRHRPANSRTSICRSNFPFDEHRVESGFTDAELRARELVLVGHERHPQHVGGAAGAQRHAGGDDDALAGLGEAFLAGDLARRASPCRRSRGCLRSGRCGCPRPGTAAAPSPRWASAR